MALPRRTLIALLIVAALMAIFPPWTVRVRERLTDSFGPPHAGGYSLIFLPPEPTGILRTRSFVTQVATIDLGRLLIQYVALGVIAVAISLRCRAKVKTQIADQFTTDPEAQKQNHTPLSAESTPTNIQTTNKQQSRWWQYQSLCSAGFRPSALAMLIALLVAAADTFVPYMRAAHQEMNASALAGQLVARFTVYVVSTIAAGYITWRLFGRNRLVAMIASCIAPFVIAAILQFGEHRRNEAATTDVPKALPTTHVTSTPATPRLTPRQEADNARAVFMQTLTESNRPDAFVADILSEHYANGMPWERMDKVVKGLPANVLMEYADWRKAEIKAGHDPHLSNTELRAIDRLHEMMIQTERYSLNHNGRYPPLGQWSNFPTNPFTNSNRIALVHTATRTDGWSYNPLNGHFRLVLPTGLICRGLGPENIEVCE